MSRIGKKFIGIPEKVKVKLDGQKVAVPLGTMADYVFKETMSDTSKVRPNNLAISIATGLSETLPHTKNFSELNVTSIRKWNA